MEEEAIQAVAPNETDAEKVPTSTTSDKTRDEPQLRYGVDETPPPHFCIVYGIQLAVSSIGGPFLMSYLIRSVICGSHDNLLFAELLSTSYFMTGLCTLLQVTFGVRLPVIEASSSAFLVPIATIMATEQWRCPPACSTLNGTFGNVTLHNEQSIDKDVSCGDVAWRPRLLAVSGSLAVASVVQCVLGLTGAVGFLQNYIGPLTIAPTIALIGITLAPLLIRPCSYQWGISFFMMALYLLFALVLARVEVPLPTWTRRRGFSSVRLPLFHLFPLLFTVLIGWMACLIFTVTNVFSDDPAEPSYHARTDVRLDVIDTSRWFFLPYPGNWGMPTFSVSIFVGMLVAIIQSTAESIGDYYATAALCQVPTPPKHAVNRGIFVEGFSSMLSGLLGACHATTTYSSVLGIISSTGVGSRAVFQIMAVTFILFGMFGKFGAILSMCPDPVLSGVSVVLIGFVTSAGLSSLRHCDMTKARNMAILGTSLMIGIMLPKYFADNPGAIKTGNITTDQVLTVFLSSGMIIGGTIGFVLDNTLPGTPKERGIDMYLSQLRPSNEARARDNDVYDLPWGISSYLRKSGTWVTYVPFLPQYDDRRSCLTPCQGKTKFRKPSSSSQHSGDAGVGVPLAEMP